MDDYSKDKVTKSQPTRKTWRTTLGDTYNGAPEDSENSQNFIADEATTTSEGAAIMRMISQGSDPKGMIPGEVQEATYFADGNSGVQTIMVKPKTETNAPKLKKRQEWP